MTRSTPLHAAVACALALAAGPVSAQQGPQSLDAIKLGIGMHSIRAEVARSPQERSIGLMARRTMPTNDGMLFVFDEPGVQCFWMKNTLLPLAIAFIADDGSIVNIDAMQPQTLDSHCSAKPVRFVLEMNEAWFAKRGVKPGMKLQGAPFAR